MSNNVHHQRKVPSYSLIYIMHVLTFFPVSKKPSISGSPLQMSCLGPLMYARFTTAQTQPLAFWGGTFVAAVPNLKKLRTFHVSMLHFGICSTSLRPSFGQGLWFTGENTAVISEVCQGGSQDDIQCDPDSAWSRLARSDDRRRDLRLALFCKVVTGQVAIGPDQIGLVAADNRTRANHRFKFRAIG